jgi:phosphoribosylformylglycinamidine synthase subunit PurQ / glutaminase
MKLDEIRVCVLRIEGTNCEQEAYDAFKLLGASPEKVHLKQLTGQAPEEMRRDLDDYHILMFPGGFSAGDYVRAGAIFGARVKSHIAHDLENFVASERPVLGVCNGFQILVELGLLPSFDEILTEEPQAALYTNDSGRFECIPTYLKNENHGKCAFTSLLPRGEVVMFPSAHAEGNLRFPADQEEEILGRLEEEDQIVFRYVDPNGDPAGYPWCPNGAVGNIAGICNPAGNVLGLMPHPERVMFRHQHPDWTRMDKDPSSPGDGRVIFESVLDYVKKRF